MHAFAHIKLEPEQMHHIINHIKSW